MIQMDLLKSQRRNTLLNYGKKSARKLNYYQQERRIMCKLKKLRNENALKGTYKNCKSYMFVRFYLKNYSTAIFSLEFNIVYNN